ncbi:bifunctional adenosylcobinamide kinase/adenosylcobinamide-phosphate guanylyltransferase [Clostridium sardiniense]|uniref:bifunctional adenosylcobinamide kinase/adenosylcobinamide-phosphate guanylyltransferase n=1 Tax=Clostridium sardiniense TaxID=29369 RepID=UPI003D33C8E9
MKIAVIGGTRSGKSFLGEEICKRIKTSNNIKYIATMEPHCDEDLKRIEGHLERRKDNTFITLEAFRDLDKIINKINKLDTILLDSVTTLLNNEMFTKDGVKKDTYKKIAKNIIDLSNECKNIVVVTDYIFSDSILYDDFTNEYRKELAYLNRLIVKDFDIVIECNYNNFEIHKGNLEGRKIINEIY